MSLPRDLSGQEIAVIVALLQAKPDTVHHIQELGTLLAVEMNDGGMRSLLLNPKGQERKCRSLGKQLVAGEFIDSDGTVVSVALNTDREGGLYELDVWKVDFSPLVRWPDPSAIRIVG